jgi:sortase A
MRLSRWIERILFTVGIVCCAIFALRMSYGFLGSHLGRAHVEAAARKEFNSRKASVGVLPQESKPDFGFWDEDRIKAYGAALAKHFDSPLALLEIPRLRLSVPVFNGTDDLTLDRGVGRVIGTAHVGENGNMAVAGHRDGFFRALKDIKAGDEVKLITGPQTILYAVDQIVIVKPNNVDVLANRSNPTLTLITCYPFYFIGSAPERYIVQCSLKPADHEHTALRERSPSQVPAANVVRAVRTSAVPAINERKTPAR